MTTYFSSGVTCRPGSVSRLSAAPSAVESLRVGTAVHFIGLLRSPVSWAKVGRETVAALDSLGAHVSSVSLKGFLYDEAFPLPEAVEAATARERREGWDVALDYPPNFARLTGRRRAGILIWEADRFPPHWARPAARYLDVAFVPSRFCLEAAARSGIPREKLVVAPFGVDTAVYNPDGPAAALPTGRSFNFLAVAAAHIRKGLAELVTAFRDAFTATDDVGLLIKCPPAESLSGRPWEYASFRDFLPEDAGGRIALVAGSLSEGEMAALYRAADVYVQPSYGESFGLGALEAAGCGKPVVATGWGGALSYLDGSNSWLLECDLVDAGAFAYDWRRGDGPVRMARPRVDHLAEVLRRAYEDAAARAAKAAAARQTALAFTWRNSAEAVLRTLEARSQ